jgi:hypothetical protein
MKQNDGSAPAGQKKSKRARLHAARRFLCPDCQPADPVVVELFRDLQSFRRFAEQGHPDDPDMKMVPKMEAQAFEYLLTYFSTLEPPAWYCEK